MEGKNGVEGKEGKSDASMEARLKAKAESDADRSQWRPNSTSSIYISSTLSVPDNDEIMLSVGTVLQCIILQGDGAQRDPPPRKVREKFLLFDERNYDAKGDTSDEGSVGEPPMVEDIFSFLKSVFELAQFSPECNTISLVLINRRITELHQDARIMNVHRMRLLADHEPFRLAALFRPMHAKNWRPLVLCSLLVAQKIWDDRCLANVDFPVIWRCAVPQGDAQMLDVKAVNLMEVNYLELLQYNVYVSGSLYAKYYFELRTLHESNSSTSFALKPLTKAQASRLEARSAASRTSLENQNQKKKASSFMSGAQGSAARAVIS